MQQELNHEDFEQAVSAPKVLVEFFATWCPHCQAQQPRTDEAAKLLAGEVPVYQVDVDKEPDLANEYAPEGFPTYVLFEHGKAIAALSGECPVQDVLSFVNRNDIRRFYIHDLHDS